MKLVRLHLAPYNLVHLSQSVSEAVCQFAYNIVVVTVMELQNSTKAARNMT